MQALKGVVILMTLTIAVLMTLIVYGMYQKSQNPDFKFFEFGTKDQAVSTAQPAVTPATPPAATPMMQTEPSVNNTGTGFGDITLPLAPDARIVSATVSGGRLVIISSAPKGDQVWIIDMTSGQVLGRVNAPGAP